MSTFNPQMPMQPATNFNSTFLGNRSQEEMQHRIVQLEAINRISSALRVAETLDEALPILVQETHAVLDAAAVTVWLHDKATDELYQAGASGFPNLTLRLKPGQGIAGQVFSTGETYVSPEFKSDPRTVESARAHVPAGLGGAVVPIRAPQEVVGVLYASVLFPREFTPDQVRLMSIVAEVAGVMIQRLRLHEQTVRQLQRISALQAVSTAITVSLDLQVILNILLAELISQLQVDASAILLTNPSTSTLDYAAGRGFRGKSIEQSRLRLDEIFETHAVVENQITMVPRLQQSPTNDARRQVWEEEQFVANAKVPLVVNNQVKGMIEVFKRMPLLVDQAWKDYFQALATQAAIAINHATTLGGLQHFNSDLTLAYDETIQAWAHAIDLREEETEGHSRRVTRMTVHLASQLGFTQSQLVHVRRGALLHDVGKMSVPDSILLKPGTLTADEWTIMREHPTYAYRLLSPIAHLRPALDIPRYHHEKWEGTGYPSQLQGEQIPLAARIFALADVWDALTSHRRFRAAWSASQALEYIRSEKGKHFDPKITDAFVKLVSEK
ncbi:MAG: GAF domain-containing protein [Chloroflexi bacterium]|nr:GAF domain-containing protein [Chloroflexota bacterium]